MLGHITATPKRKNFDVNIGNSSFLDSIHFTNQTASGEVYIPDIISSQYQKADYTCFLTPDLWMESAGNMQW